MNSGRDHGSDDFLELIHECADKAYNFAYRLCGNEADARDLVQEAFVKAYEHFGSYDRTRPFSTWVCAILKNIHLDELRKWERGHALPLDALALETGSDFEKLIPSREPALGAAMEAEERETMAQKALAGLAPHYRSAIVLCDVEGLSYEEISRIMECPVGTVRSRVHEARRLLKDAFERMEKGGVRPS